MIVAYSTQAGQLASDGSGRNSPFTSSFLKHIETQEEIGTVFRRVAADVYESTRHDQLPELSMSLIGEYYLKGRSPSASVQGGDVEAMRKKLLEMEEQLKQQPAQKQFAVVSAPAAESSAALAPAPKSPARRDEPSSSPSATTAPPEPPDASLLPYVKDRRLKVAMLLSSQDLERKLQTADVFKDCDLCPDMVVVPAGNFIMGAEKDQHKVTIKQGFAIARFSVTFKQWDECVAEGACSGYLGSGDEGWGRGDRPVINVNWDDTQAYVAWLSRKTGKSIPTPV